MRLYTMNGHDWTDRYPRVVEEAGRIKCQAVIDAELVCLDEHGKADFDKLHSRCFDEQAIACGFDLLRHKGDDLRRTPLTERKAALRKMIAGSKGGIQYVEHVQGDGAERFEQACKVGLEGIVSKRLSAPYKSGPCKSWIKARNPESPA